MDENSLVILDNFDTVPEKDDLFFEFTSLSFRLLATTRSNLEEVSCYQVKEIEFLEALEEIFYTYAPRGRNKPEIVREIIESVYRHTFTIEMYARTMTSASLEPEELLELLMATALNKDIEGVAGILFSGTDEDIKEGKVSLSPFMEKTKEMINASMSMEEYKNMLQQFNLAETKLPDELRIAYQNVAEDMQKYTLSEQDSFTMLELVIKTIEDFVYC